MDRILLEWGLGGNSRVSLAIAHADHLMPSFFIRRSVLLAFAAFFFACGLLLEDQPQPNGVQSPPAPLGDSGSNTPQQPMTVPHEEQILPPARKPASGSVIVTRLDDPELLAAPGYRHNFETLARWHLEERFGPILVKLAAPTREKLHSFLLRRHLHDVERSIHSNFMENETGQKYDAAAERHQLALDLGAQDYVSFSEYESTLPIRDKLSTIASRLNLRGEPLSNAQIEIILDDVSLQAMDDPRLLASPSVDFAPSFQRRLTSAQLAVLQKLSQNAADGNDHR